MTNFLANVNWPAPTSIHTRITTRIRGQSKPPFDQNNLALHVGDNAIDVLANRCKLISACKLPSAPQWLEQTHSNRCILVEETSSRNADASITRTPNQVLAIMTADCLPIMLCNQQGTEIAAIHAGWRGLVNGVIENTLIQLKSAPQEVMAWIGPGICHSCYEVGDEVRNSILEKIPAATTCFTPSLASTGQVPKWMANLPQLAELILLHAKVNAVYQSNLCTFEEPEKFYSYRRTPQTGRIATLIWFN